MPDGNPSSESKEKRAQYNKKYREAHPDQVKQAQKEWRLSNKDRSLSIHRKSRLSREEKAKETTRKYLYKLPPEQFNQMHQEQDGRCASCDELLIEGKQTHIDHNHKTGLIRGLLCGGCNLGLGQFKDDIERLSNAIRYLREDEERSHLSTHQDRQDSSQLETV